MSEEIIIIRNEHFIGTNAFTTKFDTLLFVHLRVYAFRYWGSGYVTKKTCITFLIIMYAITWKTWYDIRDAKSDTYEESAALVVRQLAMTNLFSFKKQSFT